MLEALEWPSRDRLAGTLRDGDVGAEATLCGWIDKSRDRGGIAFADVRDHSGIAQIVADEDASAEVREVLAADGVVQAAYGEYHEELSVLFTRIITKRKTHGVQLEHFISYMQHWKVIGEVMVKRQSAVTGDAAVQQQYKTNLTLVQVKGCFADSQKANDLSVGEVAGGGRVRDASVSDHTLMSVDASIEALAEHYVVD